MFGRGTTSKGSYGADEAEPGKVLKFKGGLLTPFFCSHSKI